MILGGSAVVWDDVLTWEEIYGKPWDGLIVIANDSGCHWPREFDHWVTLHPNKMENWQGIRAMQGLPGKPETWGRRANLMDHSLKPWAGGASGMLAIQVAQVLGCTRAVLCGIPMTPTPHFSESAEHNPRSVWSAVAGHWRAWETHQHMIQGWVRSMSGRTCTILGGLPTMEWLRGESGEEK